MIRGRPEKRGPGHSWTVNVPVYQSSDCSNPTGSIKIVGFTSVKTYNVVTTGGSKNMQGTVTCHNTEPERGGGGPFGTTGAISGLVE